MSLNNPLAQISDFELRLLRVFKAVVEAGSFSAAERLLGISSSAISLHMSDLEKRLGMRLCQRGRAGFALTDEGRQVLGSANALLAAVEGFKTEINQLHHTLRGELNIGLMNNLVTQPQMRITHALRALQGISDEILINISMSTPTEIELGLMDGRLHVGAFPLVSPLSNLEYVPLYDERSFLYCSHDHPWFAQSQSLDIALLDQQPAIAPAYRMTPQAVAMHDRLRCTATATDREGIAFLILTGGYMGFLPDHYAANWVRRNLMRAIRPDAIYFDVSLTIATRKARRYNRIVDRFLKQLLQSEDL
ncbi:LysR family transcriptional regulator [Paenalcaligenes niemegkensis]|uniref:LysR family transcriptional regulator n=1 Tax=Paenalcaligenes niemegkensis TaxID=2895469 RepID=UPI001EE8F1D4|nr:LysR family transcriptional regulator [Paenalcaligenes niemegkensis]MCQ9616098.1 LysR family transcriptional regulator [Paenalcaligenes niemegkensis]